MGGEGSISSKIQIFNDYVKIHILNSEAFPEKVGAVFFTNKC